MMKCDSVYLDQEILQEVESRFENLEYGVRGRHAVNV
jgi:hypothetical protein